MNKQNREHGPLPDEIVDAATRRADAPLWEELARTAREADGIVDLPDTRLPNTAGLVDSQNSRINGRVLHERLVDFIEASGPSGKLFEAIGPDGNLVVVPAEPTWMHHNRTRCARWIEAWKPLVVCLRTLDIAPDLVRNLKPPRAEWGALVELFVRLMGARTWDDKFIESLAQDTASWRRENWGGSDPARGFFGWLVSELAGVHSRRTAAVAEARRAEGAAGELGPPPLTAQQQRFRDLLLERSPDDPITGPALCDSYLARFGEAVAESDFRKHVVPPLKGHGAKNIPRRGYYFPLDAHARCASAKHPVRTGRGT